MSRFRGSKEAAEETGLIVPIGAWVLRAACRQLARWDAEGMRGLELAVNLSGRQLGDPTLVQTAATTLSETGIEPSRLCLEITESVLMKDAAVASAFLWSKPRHAEEISALTLEAVS